MREPMMADTQKPAALTYEEAAAQLHVSVQAVRDFITAGKLRRGRRREANGRYRLVVNAEDVKKLADERKRNGEGEVIWEE